MNESHHIISYHNGTENKADDTWRMQSYIRYLITTASRQSIRKFSVRYFGWKNKETSHILKLTTGKWVTSTQNSTSKGGKAINIPTPESLSRPQYSHAETFRTGTWTSTDDKPHNQTNHTLTDSTCHSNTSYVITVRWMQTLGIDYQ
jgi:hypothetical protein